MSDEKERPKKPVNVVRGEEDQRRWSCSVPTLFQSSQKK